jgi:hypothetical protein
VKKGRKLSRVPGQRLDFATPRRQGEDSDFGWVAMMSAESAKAKVVHIHIREDASGVFIATSKDLRGLLVAKTSLEELFADIPRAIRELYEASGVSVVVTPACDPEHDQSSWVAVPADVARRALSELETHH